MIISRTPLRMSFAGGGSDLSVYYRNGYGAVVSAAVNMYLYITVNKKFDDLIRVSYSKTEMVDSVDKVEHNIIREALKLVGVERGVEVVYMGDMPLGSAGIGLGSSSGLAVGALNALYAYKGEHVSAKLLAQKACEIEIEILGNPIGKQDQYIASYGGLNYIQFNKDESVYVDPIICNKETKENLNRKLMLFYTGISRISSSVLKEQKANIGTNKRILDHMVAMAQEMRARLCNNDLTAIGELLHEGWTYKKKLASLISNPMLDEYYEKARQAGASGGKMLGAGGGGFLLFFCEEKYQNKVREALKDLKEVTFRFEPQGSKIIYVSD
jgi:D-glycero-alpha-D-manno-heptose-7-phosphate kinase